MPWVSIREASEMLKISVRTIQRMVAAGTLPNRLQKGLRMVFLADGSDSPSTGQESTRDPILLEPLFDVYEGLSALEIQVSQIVVTHRKFSPDFEELLDLEGQPTLVQWERLYERIKVCRQTVEQFVRELCFDPNRLNDVYRTMMRVRIRWMDYEERSGGDGPSDGAGPDGGTNPVYLITAIIENLRKLLISSATHGDSPAGSEVS